MDKSTSTETKKTPPIIYNKITYVPNFFQYHVYYCLILRDHQNQLGLFSDKFLKNLKEKNFITA